MIDIENAKKEFIKYTDNYDANNPHIYRKIYHSLRVMEISKEIAENCNLDKEQIELATLIGLLHDIARFEQRKRYNTFFDKISVDHGNLGVEILEENNFIRKFVKSDKYDDIIKSAIKNHNKYKIEDNLNGEALLQAKIIRDADKIDIFYEAKELFWSTKEEIENVEKSYISEKYFEQFLSGVPIVENSNHTPLDKVLLLIAFIYDINFEYSLKYIYEKDYINKILDRFNFKNTEIKLQIEEVRKMANNFVKENKI